MSRTIPTRGVGDRQLTVVHDVHDAQDACRGLQQSTDATIQLVAQQVSPRQTLRPAARLDVEQARKFVMELDTAAAAASPLLAMFLLGRCAEHAQALLDVLDSVVQP